MTGSVNIKLRPIKIAFLVDPRNKKAVLEAIKINSFLWGGTYNPIIPVLKKVPAVWKKNDKFINFRSNAKAITLGYIDAFDPDYFVVVGGCDVKHLNLSGERIISVNDILTNVDSDGTPSYGVGLFEILNHFIDKELKFVRKHPLNIYFTDFEKKNELFLASIFGKLQGNIDKVIRKNYRNHLDAKDKKVNINNYAELFKPSTLFIRRFTSLDIDARSSGRGLRDACLFFLDAQNNYDVIDYWNLRAMGWRIIPVPKQSATSDATKQLATKFIEEHFGQSRYNADIFYDTTIMKARSIEEKDVQDFIKSLNIPKPANPKAHKFVFQYWYPRIWDEWARDKDGVDGCDLEAGESDHEISEIDNHIHLKTVDPEFISRFGGNGTPRFVNKINFNFYGGKDMFAEIIPSGGIELIRAIGGMEPDSWRFSKKGIFYLSPHTHWSIYLETPLAEKVFSAWMKSMGWKIELSSAGRIASQMVKRLNGIRGLSILSHEGVLELLKKMENGKAICKDEFFAEISKVANQGRMLRDKNRIAEWLLETKMVRLGVELQCSVCQQHSWYSIKDLDYELQCQNCLEEFRAPCHSPDDIRWAYRTFGPFSLPGRAYGVYSVLLTTRFFSQLLLDRPTTPMMSFIAEKNGVKIEVDLGLFFSETKFGVSNTELIFAECKSFNDEFSKKDVDRMKLLSKEFPGAVLVFASLKKSLSKKEQKLIKPLVNKGRRMWKSDHPYNPVLILTSTELFSDWGPPECWRDAGNGYKIYAEKYKHFWRELIPLCDISQQIYLGMKPWHEWLDERRERRRKKKTGVNISNIST